MRTLIVNDKFNDKKLFSFFEHEFPNVPKSVFYKALRKKDIRINDLKVSENITLHSGDEVKLYILDKYLEPSNKSFDIVYEDKNILVVNKEKGIEVTGTNSLSEMLALNRMPLFSLP